MKSLISIALLLNGIQTRDTKPWRIKRNDNNAQNHIDEEKEKLMRKALAMYENEKNPTTILEWYSGHRHKGHTWMKKLPQQCGGCWQTNNRNMEKTADALLVTLKYVKHSQEEEMSDIPDMENRNPNQYWIFWPREAASKGSERATAALKDNWDGAFNLTLSYRRDSDIPRPFGNANSAKLSARYRYDSEEGWIESIDYQTQIDIFMAQKNPVGKPYATWVVSNCENISGASTRWTYAQQLIKAGLKLDGYGECFNQTLLSPPWVRPSQGGEVGILSKYKFYLAFENSIHCTDYISEKFWRNSLGTGMVPIVYGPHKSDVKEMAPKNSFIMAEDFSSPKELVKYLEYLDRNDTAYLEYHAWRKETPVFVTPFQYSSKNDVDPEHQLVRDALASNMACDMCKTISKRKQLNYPKKIIKSVSKWWWMDVHDSECTAGSILPEWLTSMPKVTMKNSYDELKTVTLKDNSRPKRSH